MTQEKKAKELVDRFLEEMPRYLQGKLGRETAKESALICVDEILQVLWHNHEKNSEKMYRYYIEVKQVINKL